MKALIVVVMGGIGHVLGGLVAGLVLGLAETMAALLLDPGLITVINFAIFSIVLLWRPQGLFGERITPNHHKLAREFVLLDNFYVNSDVSADGHNWSTAAIASDYVQKMWPNSYAGRRKLYDYEGQEGADLASRTRRSRGRRHAKLWILCG